MFGGRLGARPHLDPGLTGRLEPRHAPQAPQVFPGGAHHVHPGVDVLDPVDRDLVDTQSVVLGEQEQLGVEEPRVVAGDFQQRPEHLGAGRLESALGIGEADPVGEPDDAVVAAGDELAARPAHRACAGSQPGADREVRVPAGQGRDQREQSVEARGEVHVHVRHDVRVARAPDRAQRESAALAVQVDDADPGQLVREATGGGQGFVGARVVGDSDPPGEGEAPGQAGVKRAQAAGQGSFLVVDRNDDVHRRGTGVGEKRTFDGLEGCGTLHAGGEFGEVGVGVMASSGMRGRQTAAQDPGPGAAASLLP